MTIRQNNACDILSSWIALEVLSPQTFHKPEDLAGANGSIAKFENQLLPWEGDGEVIKENYRLYYQVVLETINFEKAVLALLKTYADKRIDPPVVKGEAVLAVIVLDNKGRLVETPAAAISSFAWGLPQALAGDLRKLAGWSEAEKDLIEGVDKILRRTDINGQELPIDKPILEKARNYLISTLNIPDEFICNNSFAFRAYEYSKNPEAPDPILLNSFFVGDLIKASSLFQEGKAPSNLQRYIGLRKCADRKELLHDKRTLEDAIAPALIPPARWPGSGRHPLVVLQQAAVNLALSELNTDGILAVNGPPGTGKTTLLRDIVAGIVTSRAEVMCAFDDPAEAFKPSGQKLSAGQAWLTLYELDERLKGFEILIASSNNKAVENVSAELPGIHAIAEDAHDLRYFTSLSDALLQRQSWGLIAAALGNVINRNNFRKEFWWNEDVGLSVYLAAAATGNHPVKEFIDPETRNKERRLPRIIAEECPPISHDEALERWMQAKAKFKAALEKSRITLSQLEKVRQTVLRLSSLEQVEIAAEKNVKLAQEHITKARNALTAAEAAFRQSELFLGISEQRIIDLKKLRPGFFARLFKKRTARMWNEEYKMQKAALQIAQSEHRKKASIMDDCRKAMHDSELALESAEKAYRKAANRFAKAKKEISEAHRIIGSHLIDGRFFKLPHTEKHIVSPWCNEEVQRMRDDVFIAAMHMHKAFIDAAAKPLRHNLGALMMVFSGRPMPDEEKKKLVPDLWSSLFLVVPGISTTFASVERMLGSIPPDTLGWLLIDEAGQALPQAAVGALMRTRRAVVVGDPIQIEPVVVLPDTLTKNICRQFKVDQDVFNAPDASAQTLADLATPYFAEFTGKYGSRFVGVPLLVHRRCEEPMFGISNAIAYDDLMVQAKRPSASSIRDLLGPSRWIDVQGQAQDKWCPEEGKIVMDMLEKMRASGIKPNLYIVTPFVIVADNLRKAIAGSKLLQGWVDEPNKWPHERIGTVHTVQGREAEAVIFVLGAPLPQQTGARNWAGSSPNLLNVAVTRGKEVLYIVGNRELWAGAGLFRELAGRLS
jgi:hypothetical protein